jgi:hypothetical protein
MRTLMLEEVGGPLMVKEAIELAFEVVRQGDSLGRNVVAVCRIMLPCNQECVHA